MTDGTEYFDSPEYLSHIKVIDLTEAIGPDDFPGIDLKFIRAELHRKAAIPIALIRYAQNGKTQPKGIRLDLDKMAFLDFPFINDFKMHNFLDKIAYPLSKYIIWAINKGA